MCQEDKSKFFKRLITHVETWINHYDPETKDQSMQSKYLHSAHPKKAKVEPSADKVMVTVFWNQEGEVVADFLAKDITILGAYYASFLAKYGIAIKHKRQSKISKGIPILQDSAAVHNSPVTRS